HILFGTFGSDMILYDQAEGYQVYRSHISESTLGDIVLSDDKKKMVMSDESGTVRVIDVGSSQVEHTFSSENLDNVYRVAYSKGVIITAGQDRRVGVYPIGGKAYHLRSDFLVYSVALSPDASVGIYSSGVNHDLQLFDIISREKIDRLVGHHAVVNKITFLNEHILISSGDEKDIYIWQLD
ncbi:MAG: nitrate reductase, partial [Campylobacterota bacterium]|nr:nitrate reductase [Campylobacterota bacterium]